MEQLLEQIRDLTPNQGSRLVTVVKGPDFGWKFLLSEGKLLYSNRENDLEAVRKDMDLEQITKGTGLLSSGANTLFLEELSGENKLVICGGGHVSVPVIRIGKMLGFHVTVLEDRPSFADNGRRAGADKVVCQDFGAGLDSTDGDRNTFFVIVTRGHRYDKMCLEKIIGKENAYIGMIGSRSRVKQVLEAVAEKGASADRLLKVRTPIGLPIHAETPEEIGVSIMAEIIQVKNETKRMGGFSREILSEALKPEKKHMGKVMVTIISRKGSAPRGVGAKMVVFQDGSIAGTIGGGCAEADVRQKCILLMNSTEPAVYKIDMTGNAAQEDGMVCGGVIEVLMEPWR